MSDFATLTITFFCIATFRLIYRTTHFIQSQILRQRRPIQLITQPPIPPSNQLSWTLGLSISSKYSLLVATNTRNTLRRFKISKIPYKLSYKPTFRTERIECFEMIWKNNLLVVLRPNKFRLLEQNWCIIYGFQDTWLIIPYEVPHKCRPHIRTSRPVCWIFVANS